MENQEQAMAERELEKDWQRLMSGVIPPIGEASKKRVLIKLPALSGLPGTEQQGLVWLDEKMDPNAFQSLLARRREWRHQAKNGAGWGTAAAKTATKPGGA